MGRPKVVDISGLENSEEKGKYPAKKKNRKEKPSGEGNASIEAVEAEDTQVVELNPTEVTSKTDAAQSELVAIVEPEVITKEVIESASEEAEAEAEPEVEKKPKKTEAAPKKAAKKHSHSQRFTSLLPEIDKTKSYPVDEAIAMLQKTATVKFDPSLEVHINVGVDISKSDQQIRTTTVLPHAIGNPPKLLVFGAAAKSSGVEIGDEKTIEMIEKQGKVNADKIIATAEWMPRLTKVAKILGPKGLMPNPKTGTVTSDVAKTVADFQGGLTEIRTEAASPIIHTRVGKLSLGEAKLKENLKALMETVSRSKPSAVKRNYLKSVYLNTTMGPSLRLDLSSLS